MAVDGPLAPSAISALTIAARQAACTPCTRFKVRATMGSFFASVKHLQHQANPCQDPTAALAAHLGIEVHSWQQSFMGNVRGSQSTTKGLVHYSEREVTNKHNKSAESNVRVSSLVSKSGMSSTMRPAQESCEVTNVYVSLLSFTGSTGN